MTSSPQSAPLPWPSLVLLLLALLWRWIPPALETIEVYALVAFDLLRAGCWWIADRIQRR